MLKADVEATVKSLAEAEKSIQDKLERMVKMFAADVLRKAAENTPRGDHIANASWYEMREESDHLAPIHGLARFGWDAAVDTPLELREGYGPNTSEVAYRDAIAALMRYNLGEQVLIGNKRNYVVSALENGYSKRYPDGIMQPTINQIEQAYRADLQRYYKGS